MIRVSIHIDSVVTADDADAATLACEIRNGLGPGPVDPDLVMWLLDAAVVRSTVTAS